MRTEDGYIVQKCLSGEPEAFGLLVDKYKASIYAFVYVKLRNFHDAEDVTQDIFIKAYQKLANLRRYDSFLAWLYCIASDLCRKFIRSRAARPDREFIEDQSSDPREGTWTGYYREDEIYESLHEALDSLPEVYREVLTLYYLGGMNNREVARFLGTSPTAVRQRLSRARLALKEGMLAMMNETFEQQKLQASFTFRIVEAARRIKIHPMPRMTGLPWGLSLATGLFLAALGLSPRLSLFNLTEAVIRSPLSSETEVMKVGEIPVDILKISQIPLMASRQGNGDKGGANLLNPRSTFFLAPRGEGGTWTKRADMPTARFAFSTSAVDGKIYAIGGATWNTTFNIVEEYDPATDIWTKKADMPSWRYNLSTSVVNGRIYAIGGLVGNIDSLLATVEEYNPVEDKWTKKSDMPTPRYRLSTSVVNGKIYAVGGNGAGDEDLATVEEYNPESDRWTRKADMPTARHTLYTSAVDGKIYAIGGGARGVCISTVEEYDPATDKWTKKTDMPTPRAGVFTEVVNGRIYAFGGTQAGIVKGDNDIILTVEIYDPAKDQWTKGSDMPTPRWFPSASMVGGKIYVIGGWDVGDDEFLSTVEEYTPEGWPFKQSVSPQGKLPTKWGEKKQSK